MSRSVREIIAAAIFFALFAWLAWLATDFGPRARMIPLPLAIAGMALAAIQIVLCLAGRPQQRLKMIALDESALPAADASGGTSPAAAGSPRPARAEWRAYASIAGLTALVLAVGPVIAIFAFTAGYFLRTHLYSTARSLIYAALFTAGVQVLFFTALQIEPYYGLLAPLMAHIR